jgi:hypothetical protein
MTLEEAEQLSIARERSSAETLASTARVAIANILADAGLYFCDGAFFRLSRAEECPMDVFEAERAAAGLRQRFRALSGHTPY